jgi:ATP-dependent helicase/nuclease subunit A
LAADYSALREAYDEKEMEEYYRLLYVAITRARDELRIFGIAGARNAAENSWYAELSKVLGDYARAKTEDGDIIIEN